MGMFGSALKKIATPENLYLLGATLKDIGDPGADNFSQAQASMAARQAKAQKTEMLGQIGGLFGGQAASRGIVGAGYGSAGNPGDGMGTGLDMRNPQTQALLFRAQQMGIDVGPLIQMYSATKPDIAFSPDGEALDRADRGNIGRRFANRQNVNDTVIDMNDPNNTNRVVPKAPVNGAMPVYDNMGRVTDWTLPQGAQGAMQAASQAEQLGKTRGGLINAPMQDGSIAMMTGSQFLDQGQGRIPGLGRTQTPVEALQAQGAARGDLERAQAVQDRAAGAGKQLAALDEMESLLPDVIAGFGAGTRLNVARAQALAGDERARRKVAATETFINQGRILVASIIKTFGSNPTEGERKFAETMSGADAELNPETLKEGIRLQRERINRDLQDAGRAGGSGGGQGSFKPRVSPEDAIAELRRRGRL